METKHCNGCNQDKTLDAFYTRTTGKSKGKLYPICRKCQIARSKQYQADHREYMRKYYSERAHRLGINRPIQDAKDSGPWLGDLSEQVLSRYFKNVSRMPKNNPGYDFLCERGFKIDAKASCLRDRGNGRTRWCFCIERNTIADYFLCLAFNNRSDLTPMHIWLLPSNAVSHYQGISITNSPRGLVKWSEFEKPIDKVVACCGALENQTMT